MSRSYYIVLNDEEQRLCSEGVLTTDYFGKNTVPQMYLVLNYMSFEKYLQDYSLLFTKTKRIIYDE